MDLIYCYLCGGRVKKKGPRRFVCENHQGDLFVNPAPGTNAVITNKKGEILLTRRKYPPKKGYWDFPGGFVEFGETAEEAMKRELKEEMGVTVLSLRYLRSYPDVYREQGIKYNTLGLFFRVEIKETDLEPSDDISAIRWFNLQKLPTGKIAFESSRTVLRDLIKD